MNELETQQVINGSWGEVWVESDYMAEAKGIEATIEIEYEDIKSVPHEKIVKNVNPYLVEGNDLVIEKRATIPTNK